MSSYKYLCIKSTAMFQSSYMLPDHSTTGQCYKILQL